MQARNIDILSVRPAGLRLRCFDFNRRDARWPHRLEAYFPHERTGGRGNGNFAEAMQGTKMTSAGGMAILGSARASRACFGALAETRGNPAMGSERGSPAIAGRVASPEIDDHVTFARPFAAVNS
jgi:hypothetical protein